MSVNTRELLVEEGGFRYDSECYNDDIPYWTKIGDKAHLVVPYNLVVNDCRFVLSQGYGSPEHFLEYAKATLNRLLADGDDASRMMSLGGTPGSADGRGGPTRWTASWSTRSPLTACGSQAAPTSPRASRNR